jgi:AcrR family transcriptional regulator
VSAALPIPPSGTTAERILAAATELFADRGFEGTSTRAIGRAAQANIAMIAYHYGDKEGLYRAVLEATYAAMLDVALPSPLPSDPAERIRLLVTTAYNFGRSRKDEVRLMMRHVIEHGSLPEEVRSSGTARLFGKVTELVEALGLPGLAERRLELMSINHLIVRYVLSDLADVRTLTEGADPIEAVSRHLGDVAVRLLLPAVDLSGEGMAAQSL